MEYKEARELASLRNALRDLVAARSQEDASELLSQFRTAADRDPSLTSEYERWSLRVHLLQVEPRAA